MEILLYSLLFVVGFTGFYNELVCHRTSYILFIFFSIIFVLIACDRSNSNMDLRDLYYYIERFKNDEDSYFEPGYVFVTDIVKLIFGYNKYALITVVSVWIITCILISSRICSNNIPVDTIHFLPFNQTSYYFNLFFFNSLYWGVFFTCMTWRVGLATSLLYISSAFAINRKMVMALLFALLSIFFHTSCLIFFLSLFILFFIKELSKKVFFIWFLTIVGIRFIFSYVFQIGNIIESIVLSDELFAHYINYLDGESEIGGVFSPQEIVYHLFGLIMLKGNLEDIRYNRAVMIYYLGLSAGILFGGTGIAMRIQWLFLSMIIFALYYFVNDRHFSINTKIRVIFVYSLIEIVMTIRQFGWYF